MFSLGSWWLPVFHSQTREWYSGIPALLLLVCAYGTFILFGAPFQATLAWSVRRWLGPQHYIRHKFPCGVWFGLFPFRSPLLGESRLVSFPPLTKMFPFWGFPFLSERRGILSDSATRSLIWVSTDLRLRAPTRGVSLLAAPFFGAQAWSSTRRRGMSGLFGVMSMVFVWCEWLGLVLFAWCHCKSER